MIPRVLKPRFFDVLSNVPGRYIKPEPYHRATGLVKKVYDQVADEFFINGPMTTHAVHPRLLAGLWMAEREILLADQTLTREDKEALAVTFSQVNGCTYCEDLLNSVVYGAEEQQLAELMRFRKHREIEDEKTRLLHSWALESYDVDATILSRPPFSVEEAPEAIGTAMMINYFNRYVRVFFSGTPLAAPFSSRMLKSILYRLTGMELRESVVRRLEPGRSVNLLEPARLPHDLKWAEGNATISAALARWSCVMHTAAREKISVKVRNLVEDELSTWQGEPMGLSRAWLDPKVAGLDAGETTAARLALLTALSPAQMSDDVVAEYRNHHDGDDALILTVAWAAFMASRRVARWLADKSGYFDEQSVRLAS